MANRYSANEDQIGELALRVKQLEDERNSLKLQVRSLETETQIIGEDLEQIQVQKASKENKKKREEQLQQTCKHSSSTASRFDKSRLYGNSSPSSSTQKPVLGAEALVQESNNDRSTFFQQDRTNTYHTDNEDQKAKLSLRMKKLEAEIKCLKVQLKSLRMKKQKLQEDLGEILVQTRAEENKKKREELFQQIYGSPSSKANRSVELTSTNPPLNNELSSSSENENLQRSRAGSNDSPTAPVRQAVLGAEALEQESNEQRSTQQSGAYTSVCNAYKSILLLYLTQKIPLCEMLQLKEWVTHNFFIPACDGTSILFQLGENGVLDAFGFRKLEEFFESIGRFDLAYLILEFHDGNYSLLRQIPDNPHRAMTDVDNHCTSKCFLYLDKFD